MEGDSSRGHRAPPDTILTNADGEVLKDGSIIRRRHLQLALSSSLTRLFYDIDGVFIGN